MRSKLGLFTDEPEDTALVADLLDWMQRSAADFTNTFRTLVRRGCRRRAWPTPILTSRRGTVDGSRVVRGSRSRHADAEDLMRRHNPAFIPRNHKVEEALEAATAAHDFSVMERLLDVLRRPYDYAADLPDFSSACAKRRALPHVLRDVNHGMSATIVPRTWACGMGRVLDRHGREGRARLLDDC